jgi:hypothetical protein
MSREARIKLSEFATEEDVAACLLAWRYVDGDGAPLLAGIGQIAWRDSRASSAAMRAGGIEPNGVMYPAVVVAVADTKRVVLPTPVEAVYELAFRFVHKFGGQVEVCRYDKIEALITRHELLVPPDGELLSDEFSALRADLLCSLASGAWGGASRPS